jgi:CsoR family transcriptional regulator, copper-sensing transcriptional repressor
MLSEDDKKKLMHRLARVSGQVEAVRRMIDEGAYCVDVLMQLSAATGALGKVGQIVLENHLRTCVADAMRNGDGSNQEKKLDELVELFRKYANIVE